MSLERAPPTPRWAWPVAGLLIIAALLAPFALVDVPAVLDYPNHLARFYVLAHPADPFLSTVYAAHWTIVPNLGMDVIGRALLGVLPTDVAGRMQLALALLAPGAGAVLHARAAFGRWTWWSLGAGAIAFNGVFFLGFLNFLLSLGVALAGAAAWRVLRARHRDVAATAAGLAFALLAFGCHLLGFGFFGLLIGAREAETLLAERHDAEPRTRRAVIAAIRLAVALGPAALLYLFTHRATAGGDALWWNLGAKLPQSLTPFETYDPPVTIATALVVVGVTVFAWRGARRASGTALALAALALLYLLAPFAVAGGTFFDSRLPLMAALLIFAGLAPLPSRRAGLWIAAAFGAVIVARSVDVADNWLGRAIDLAELRADFALIPAGARVLPARTEQPDTQPGAFGRVIPNLSRVDEHLGALVVIERRAFWPLLFADPGQQPLLVRPPYDRLAQPLGRAAAWADLAAPTPAVLAASPYLRDWRGRFDYALVVGPPPPAASIPAGLRLLRAGPETSLYRVVR